MENLSKQLADIIKHPIEFLVKHSSLYKNTLRDYNQAVENRNELEKDYTDLSKKINTQREIIVELKNEKVNLINKVKDYNKLQNNYIQIQKDSIELQEKNAYLQRNLEKKTQELINIKYDVENALEVCRHVKTGQDVIEARVKENSSANTGLEDWIRYQKRPYEEKITKLKKELSKTRSSIFKIAVKSIIQNDSNFEKIPFLYYDFIDKKLIYDKSIKKQFKGIIKKEDLKLKDLLRVIENKDLKGKNNNGIIFAIKRAIPLKHYKAKTKGENPKDLRLTTIPFHYNNKYLGVGIFLWDPRFSKQTFKDYRAAKKLEHTIENISKSFDKIQKDILFNRD